MKSSADEVADVPPGVVTVTLTVPEPEGEVAVIEVAEFTVKLVAGFPEPKSTAVAPVRFVPVMVTLVPPVVRPAIGDTLVTVGAAS